MIDGAAQLADELLSACPDITLLATSREALAVDGERVLPLGPLGGRDEGDEAVGLFLARARLVAPDFRPSPTELADIAELCETLDRLPLAIELAAARVDRMEILQIADGLLRGRSDRRARRRGGRQGDLRSVLAWSTDLLDDDERAVWRRLAVFEGGFTAEAGPAVAAGIGDGSGDVEGVLDGLVDRSLVVRGRTPRVCGTTCSRRCAPSPSRSWRQRASRRRRSIATPMGGGLVGGGSRSAGDRVVGRSHRGRQPATGTPALDRTGRDRPGDRAARRCDHPDRVHRPPGGGRPGRRRTPPGRAGRSDHHGAARRGRHDPSGVARATSSPPTRPQKELRSADADDRSWAIGTAIVAHHFAGADPPRAGDWSTSRSPGSGRNLERCSSAPRPRSVRAEFAEAADEQLRGWGIDRVDELTPSVLGPAVDVTVLSDLAVSLLLSRPHRRDGVGAGRRWRRWGCRRPCTTTSRCCGRRGRLAR